jgi:membrane peptidoglycan carboxypeptidase
MARPTAFQPAARRAKSHTTPLRFLWRLLLAFVKLALLATEIVVLAVLLVYYHYSRDLEGLEAGIGAHRPAETTQIYARDGQTLLYELVDPQGGRRTVVDLSRIPKPLRDATVAVEDSNFYENPGVDLRGIIRALWLNYQQDCQDDQCRPVSGGSTITQQLVRNVLLPPEERTRISFDRKLREAILAYRVSRKYSKDQILSLYLNEVYYGNQAYGVEAAAQAYFGKHVWELSMPEATLIAGLPQSPTLLDPLTNLEGAKARQQVTLDLMAKTGFLTPAQARAAYDAPLHFTPPATSLVAPHFVFYIRKLLEERYGPEVLYRGGLRVVTSLDLHWQTEAQRIVRERIADLRGRNATNAGVIMLSPEDEVLAMIGSVDYKMPRSTARSMSRSHHDSPVRRSSRSSTRRRCGVAGRRQQLFGISRSSFRSPMARSMRRATTMRAGTARSGCAWPWPIRSTSQRSRRSNMSAWRISSSRPTR